MSSSPIKAPVKGTPLGDYLNTSKMPGEILPEVSRWLAKQPAGNRSTDWLHPSEISSSGWCHRQSWFLLHEPSVQVVKPVPGLRLQNIFDEGHEIHRKWQNRFRDMGALYGVWEDQDGKRFWGRSVPTSPNEEYPYEYKEVPLEWPELRIHGHADGWLQGFKNEYVLEVKSIGTGTIRTYAPSLLKPSLGASFSQIKRPFSDHVKQATLYGVVLQEMYKRGAIDIEPPQKIVFIYECKENQEPKEFHIELQYENVSKILEAAHLIVTSNNPPACNLSADGCSKCRELETSNG